VTSAELKTKRQEQAIVARDRLNGRRFHHYKGGTYEVIDVAVGEATGEIVVVYRSDLYGYVWSRPLAEFEGEVSGEGGVVPRFAEATSCVLCAPFGDSAGKGPCACCGRGHWMATAHRAEPYICGYCAGPPEHHDWCVGEGCECPCDGKSPPLAPLTPKERLQMLLDGEPTDTCDCIWDQVPLRGPDPECSRCKGTGELPFDLAAYRAKNPVTP
jgi:hypothetical protein